MSRFFKSLGRAIDATESDAPTANRLWSIRFLAILGIAYSFTFSPFNENTRGVNAILLFGSLAILMLVSELRRIWAQVERDKIRS